MGGGGRLGRRLDGRLGQAIGGSRVRAVQAPLDGAHLRAVRRVASTQRLGAVRGTVGRRGAQVIAQTRLYSLG